MDKELKARLPVQEFTTQDIQQSPGSQNDIGIFSSPVNSLTPIERYPAKRSNLSSFMTRELAPNAVDDLLERIMTRSALAIGQEDTPPVWHLQVAAVFFKNVYLKAGGTTVFITLFFNLYFYLLNNPAFPITVMPFTWVDRLIEVQPLALPVYISMWVYVSLPPALLATRRELGYYAMAIAVTCLTGLLAFYLWPTAIPSALVDWTRYPELDFLKNIDASGNACPSLHVAAAAFSAVWLHHLLRRFGGPLWILSLNWAWCIGIAYSTIAIRQHVALDVLGGLALGLPAAWLSLRYRGVAIAR